MKARFRWSPWKAIPLTALVAAGAVLAATAIAGPGDIETKSEHWGLITRNTTGSPVGDLRDGPYGSIGHTGDGTEPPYGKGSLGIEVANGSINGSDQREKVAFGNEVDFFGTEVATISQVGFHVFQTGENAAAANGGPTNMPNITFEVDPNITADGPPGPGIVNYTSMVWIPPAAPVTDEWSPYMDAAQGAWWFTGATGTTTTCTLGTPCSFSFAKSQLDSLGSNPETARILSVAVAKGRDNNWVGAVDGLRINNKIYDFEADGVKMKGAPK